MNLTVLTITTFNIGLEPPPQAGLSGSGSLCNTASQVNLFDYLVFVNDYTGSWFDPYNSGINISDPTAVNFNNAAPGIYNFEYVVYAFNTCPNDTIYLELELTDGLQYDILSVECINSNTAYEIVVASNNLSIIVSAGDVLDNGATTTITNIPIGETVDIRILDPLTSCFVDIMISPPDCDCPTVPNPISDGDVIVCSGDAVSISATVDAGYEINWYDSPSQGTLLLTASNSFSPAETASGLYTYFAESYDPLSMCTGTIRTPVIVEIVESPEAINANYQECDDDYDGSLDFDLVFLSTLVSPNPANSVSFYNSLIDAESDLNSLLDVFNSSTPSSILYARVSNGICFQIVMLTLEILELPDIDLSVVDESCNDTADGSVTVSVSNTSEDFLISLNQVDWFLSNTISDLPPGDYMIYVENINSCIGTMDFTIMEGQDLTFDKF